MKNIAIDFGNTFIKIGLFDEDQLIESKERLTIEEGLEYVRGISVDAIVYSSVTELHSNFFDRLDKSIPSLSIHNDIKLPFQSMYQTPHTLGQDRIVGIAAVQSLYPERNVLLIDLGTCITTDFLDATGIYHGGSISPGMNMRFQAMNTFTSRLPLFKGPIETLVIGKSTQQCMESGVMQGIHFELEGFINHIESKYSEPVVVMTGGDAFFFERMVKRHIFVVSKLLLIGLNRILLLNAERLA